MSSSRGLKLKVTKRPSSAEYYQWDGVSNSHPGDSGLCGQVPKHGPQTPLTTGLQTRVQQTHKVYQYLQLD